MFHGPKDRFNLKREASPLATAIQDTVSYGLAQVSISSEKPVP